MVIEREYIVGMITEDGSILCAEHMTDDQWNHLKSDQMISRDDLERDHEKIYFCDECKEKL